MIQSVKQTAAGGSVSANLMGAPEVTARGALVPVRWAAGWPRSMALHRQAGVGLIEVMVAVLVLSIGFLGVGALLATTMSTNNSAMARSMATIATYSVMDAMRADLINAKNAKYNTTVTANACPTATTTLAQAQLGTWCQQLKNTLGDASTTMGTISCTTLGVCTVTVKFDDSRAGVGGTADQTVTTKAML